MKFRYLVFFIPVFVWNIACNSVNTATRSTTAIGMPWKVTDYYILPSSKWTKSDANKLIFKEAFFTKHSISFNNQTCKAINFHRSPASLSHFLSTKYNSSTSALQLKEQEVTVISTNCKINGFKEYLQLDDGKVLFFINRVAFLLMPSVAF